ncbi:uncharacterized protein LTR77_009181 [Saxophila tyrrhenica]|uniref:Alpha-L-rhamnosidase C-terminal domain-containing protein n=1 Tax=Saxophila tyrrhenica TaxID=1690608 RepID=A0AAV9NYH5_9PEZI|nr:hypothetical protein LTR77_009181 [Saxophila tyrrhenica]
MATPDPSITTWEGIGHGGGLYEQGYIGMAHGWSTGIVSLMSNYVLGVVPTTPGLETWILRWAKGRVGTPQGAIEVHWTLGEDAMSVHLTVPAGTKVNVQVPVKKGQFVLLNGEQIEALIEEGYVNIGDVKSGVYTADVRQRGSVACKPG